MKVFLLNRNLKEGRERGVYWKFVGIRIGLSVLEETSKEFGF